MLTVQIVLLLLCLAFEALFAGMEIGIISINRVRLQHLLKKEEYGARELAFFLENPERLFGTTLVGTNLCMVMASVLAAGIAIRLLGPIGSWISSLLMTVVVLIFAEYLPKAWFQSNPAMRTRHWAPLLRFFGRLFHPLGYAAFFVAKLIFRVRTDAIHHEAQAFTRDDLSHVTLENERTGVLSPKEREMIHGVFRFDRTTCREIMTPLEDVVCVAASMPRCDFLDLARRQGHNRYPVYRESVHQIVGIVNVLDAATDPTSGNRPVSDYMRPPQFVSDDTSPDKLLLRMRLSRQPTAMVSDRDGRLCGLVTMEDVLGVLRIK